MKFRKKFFMPVIAVFAVIMSCKGPAGPAGAPGAAGVPGSGAPKEVTLTVTVKGKGAVTIGDKTITETAKITVLNGDSVSCEIKAAADSLINTALNNYSELKASDGEALYRKKEETIEFPVNGTSNLTVFFAKEADLAKEQCVVTFRAANKFGSVESSRLINGEKHTVRTNPGASEAITVPKGTEVTFTAIPESGFVFDGFTDTEANALTATSAESYTASIEKHFSIWAKFKGSGNKKKIVFRMSNGGSLSYKIETGADTPVQNNGEEIWVDQGKTITVTAKVEDTTKGTVSQKFGIYDASNKLNSETVSSGAHEATATYVVQEDAEVRAAFIYSYTYKITTGANGKVAITQNGTNAQTVPAAQTDREVTVTGPKGSSVEISAESVNATGQKYLFDKWTSSGSDTDFNNEITTLNEKPLDERTKILTKLDNDREITANFIEAYDVTITNNTDQKAKGVLKFQYGKETEVVVASGQPVKRVVPKGNLTIKAVQDASDGYIPYEWKEKVGTDYKPIENTTYKKDYSVAISSNKDFSVSFVQRYAIDNNAALRIAHPKDADGNIVPDTEATELIIPATVNGVEVTAIEDNASGKKGVFEGWTSLKKITFPETLTTIGARAFAGCTALTDFPKDSSVTTINGNAFDGCTALKTLELPASCTTIQGEAFNNCSGLSTVTFNNPNLAGINFSYLTDKSAFTGCTEISTVNFNDDVINGDGIFSIGGTTTIATTPRRIHMLFPSAATKLTTVIFGDGITAFKGNTPYFQGCTALETVDLGKNNMGFEDNNAGYMIPNNMFNGCTSLKNVTLCDDIEVIGNFAFKGCESLKSITLPAKLTKMNREVFAGCSSLETIKLSDILTDLGTTTFSGCKALKSISIPKGVTTLPANVFKDCEALTELDLRNVTTIASGDVFSGCTSITKLIVNQGVKITALIANNLKNLIGLSTIEVQTAADVSEKQTLVVNLSTLCGDAVRGNITSIVIGDKVAIPTGTSLSALKNFKNEELKFSVPSEEWKTALVDEGIDAARVSVQ